MNVLDIIAAAESELPDEYSEVFISFLKNLIEKEKDWSKVKREYLSLKKSKGGRGSWKTSRNIERYIGIFERFFEKEYDRDPSFILIDTNVMISFIAWMKTQRRRGKGEQWSQNYIHKIYLSVVDFLRYADVQETYKMREYAPTTEEALFIDTYTDDEVRTILSLFTKENFEEFRDRINFLLKAVTGSRASEIDGLSWSDINFEEQKFAVRMKGDLKGMKYIPEPVWSELLEYREMWLWWVEHHGAGKKVDKVFFRISGSGEIVEVSDRFFYQRLKRKVKIYNENRKTGDLYLDPKKVNNKKFRSYLISLFYSLEENYELTAKLVDHKDPKTTRRYYVKLEREKKEELYDKLMPELKRRDIIG